MVVIRLLILILISINCDATKITDSIYWIGTPLSSGIGFANSAKTNSSDSLFYNPAGLGTLEESSVNLSYSSIYSTDFTNLNFVAHHELLSFGIGVQLNQSSDIEKTSFDETSNTIIETGTYNYSYSTIFFSTSIKMPFISFGYIGSTLHIHRMSIDNDTLTGESLNIGLMLRPFNFFTIGYNSYNVVPLYMRWNNTNVINDIPVTTIHQVPSYSTVGIEIIPIQLDSIKWTILADLELESSGSDETTSQTNTTNNYSPLKLGTELQLSTFTLRGGQNFRNTSFGISTRLGTFQINYTFILPANSEYLDNRHSFGINLFL